MKIFQGLLNCCQITVDYWWFLKLSNYLIVICKKKILKRAVIDTAFELSNEQIEEIKTSLENRFNKKIEVEQNINTKLLAGAVVKVDDLVIDGSLREQLRKLESQLN